MAYEAQQMFPEIDFTRSIMVGDTDTDMQFGQRLGMKTVLIESQELVTEAVELRFLSLSEFLNLL
jgi:histidinol phosphatase-like enzyme